MTTLVVEGEEAAALEALAVQLGIQVVQQVALPPDVLPMELEGEGDVEAARKGLDDLFNLY